MAQKNNIRSIRFSDELAEVINRQVGKTFTEKFENLVTRCMWELPQKTLELEEIEKEIQKRRDQLSHMSHQVRELEATMLSLFPKVKTLEEAINQAIQQWP